MSSLASLALILAAVGPQITPLDDARFRVSIVFDDDSPIGHAKAQLALMSFAQKHCKGRGAAQSEGTLYVNKAEPIRKGRPALEVGEVYRCIPRSQPG